MAAHRAYWRGYLRLSLVTCPFPSIIARQQTHFHIINKVTGNRVREQMIDEETGKVVDKDEKGRGYEVSKGHYVEIDEDELDAVKQGRRTRAARIAAKNPVDAGPKVDGCGTVFLGRP